MSADRAAERLKRARIALIAMVAIIVVLGLAYVGRVIGVASETRAEPAGIDALATSKDDCVVCHRQETPGIVVQFGSSSMAAAGVACRDCHEVEEGYPGGLAHEGTYVLNQPTSAKCSACHMAEVSQFIQSRHGLPAYVAYAGFSGLTSSQLAEYQAIEEGTYAPDKSRNDLYALEGEALTQFACESCHDVGKPSQDGSTGQCQKCHLRHEFRLEQVRRPETCNYCHIGPDHPQWEIYHESPHGIAYATEGDRWNWEAEPGTVSVEDFSAPTCALCHFGSFGAAETSHDVGQRLTWYLFAPLSERRPSWEQNQERMQSVCLQCHNEDMIKGYYAAADVATHEVNDWVTQSQDIMAPLQAAGLLTAEPFDQPIDFIFFEFWHHWGRTAKFGVWMQGPDYTQWHGAYEMLRAKAELQDMAGEMMQGAQGGE
jgi:hydroxylamine dehydrogenase